MTAGLAAAAPTVELPLAGGTRTDLSDGAPPASDGRYRPTDFADLLARIDPTRFLDDDYRDVLRALVAAVVEQEGPVDEALLVRRIARAHGFARAGGRIHGQVVRIARHHHHRCPDGFIWPHKGSPAAWTAARYPADEAFARRIEDIAPAELRATGSTDPVEIARLFGVRRLSAVARARIEKAVAGDAG